MCSLRYYFITTCLKIHELPTSLVNAQSFLELCRDDHYRWFVQIGESCPLCFSALPLCKIRLSPTRINLSLLVFLAAVLLIFVRFVCDEQESFLLIIEMLFLQNVPFSTLLRWTCFGIVWFGICKLYSSGGERQNIAFKISQKVNS